MHKDKKHLICIMKDNLMDAQTAIRYYEHCEHKALMSFYKDIASMHLKTFMDTHTKLVELMKEMPVAEANTKESELWSIMHGENMEWYNQMKYTVSNM